MHRREGKALEDRSSVKPIEVIMDIVVHDPNTGEVKTQLIEWHLDDGEEFLGTSLVTSKDD